MQPLSYLVCVLASTGAMVACDYRWKLAFFRQPKRAAALVVALVAVFLLWDSAAIFCGVFFRGDSPWMSGIELFDDMPLEEPFFLLFLVYLTINLTAAARALVARGHRIPGTRGGTDSGADR
ncbi:lycopene cyclase domain-containing protein [Corynebacterium mendelii]|uniref:Lycopene cyclase domain-containing protein n=1 Tax=Corynebacterium mendelii TaxID=2765362 RepID=A0A939IVK7_9CORY|nr:lycopene cyclase domain-containing protein [Corynebacterium mendelii]MBN9644331.1 lycopene cyclase domain-containing protein [Corynebacterium mendelii]